jgi:protein-tyrosine phosphatase
MRPRFPNDFVYLSIEDVADNSLNSISRYFGPTSDFIDKAARNKNGKILVHCWQGQSRSVSIIVAHLMKADHIRYEEAIALVRKTREQASPNLRFVQELKQYEKVLFGE